MQDGLFDIAVWILTVWGVWLLFLGSGLLLATVGWAWWRCRVSLIWWGWV